MIITDLDGTLLNSDHQLSQKNRETLEYLGDKNIPRVVATGRILYSVQSIIEEDFPIDFLIFASGAGIIDFQKMELIYSNSMDEKHVLEVSDILKEKKLNFMVHAPVPDNHYCLVSVNSTPINSDFAQRHGIYEDFSGEWQGNFDNVLDWENSASLILTSVAASEGESTYEIIKNEVSNQHVVRTTSPLDANFNWIEILPPNVSKANASLWLKDYLKISKPIMTIGNDYNDIDMLNWSDNSYVVDNAPELLKTSYDVVASNDKNGFSEAVYKFLNS